MVSRCSFRLHISRRETMSKVFQDMLSATAQKISPQIIRVHRVEKAAH
jgi:hypothetical protein